MAADSSVLRRPVLPALARSTSLTGTDATNDWIAQYLTSDDYRLASAAAGYTIVAPVNGDLGTHPAVLDRIAIARRYGEIDGLAAVSTRFLLSLHNGNPSELARALAYIRERDAAADASNEHADGLPDDLADEPEGEGVDRAGAGIA